MTLFGEPALPASYEFSETSLARRLIQTDVRKVPGFTESILHWEAASSLLSSASESLDWTAREGTGKG